MDDVTSEVLRDWGFPELIDVFQAEYIDHEALLALNPESKEIEQLIPRIGTRSKFKKALTTYQMIMSSKLEILSPSTSETQSDVFSSDALSNEELLQEAVTKYIEPCAEDSFSFHNQSLERQITGLQYFENLNDKSNPNIQSVKEVTNAPQNNNIIVTDEKKKDNSKNLQTSNALGPSFLYRGLQSLDLRALLGETIVGKVVLSTYQIKKEFDDATRRKLVDVIITSLLTKVDGVGQPITLNNLHFDELADKIVELFPDEDKELYYIKPLVEGPRQKISKGKLVDSYRNRLRQMRKVGLVPNRKRKIDATKDVADVIDDESKRACQIHCDWLRHNTAPWSSVIEHWNESRAIRQNNFQGSTGSVDSVLEEWPVLKQPLGYTLIESDYNEIFKDGLSLYSEWPQLSEKLEQLVGSSIKDKVYISLLDDLKSSDSTSDSRDATLLTLLPVLCLTSSPIRTPKCLWKPTLAESITGFILHVKIPGDLEIAREEQRDRMQKMKLPLQPYVIVVGPRLSAIEQSYINIDNTLYLMESPLKAVDICYKAFHALHARYPVESEHIWLFLQKFVYKRTTRWDKKIKSVILLMKKLNKE